MAVWPAQLPPPAINTLREKPPRNKIRTQMDKGPSKERRRTTANTRPLSFILNLLEDEVEILDNFFVATTFSGVDEFDYTHPRTGAPCKAKFVEEPDYSEVEGVMYKVAVSLEILP